MELTIYNSERLHYCINPLLAIAPRIILLNCHNLFYHCPKKSHSLSFSYDNKYKNSKYILTFIFLLCYDMSVIFLSEK